MKAILGLGGSWPLITGIKAIWAIMTVAMLAILSANSLDWKKIPKLINPMIHKGRKIVTKETKGIL